jgi:cytosine/adenosine deaminase-related metal-dependent hydrolase
VYFSSTDLGGAVLTPGFINTHHHLYQTLTRARAQDAHLFTWLRTVYPVWARIDDEVEYAAARIGLAELRAARELGVRIVASRGSIDLGVSDGGLPPDNLVEDVGAVLADTERPAALADGASVQIAVAPWSPFSATTRLMEEPRRSRVASD